jgi:hypothetical protein
MAQKFQNFQKVRNFGIILHYKFQNSVKCYFEEKRIVMSSLFGVISPTAKSGMVHHFATFRWFVNRKTISPKNFHRKAIWPKYHLTKHRVTESSFDRMFIRTNRRLTVTVHCLDNNSMDSKARHSLDSKICNFTHDIAWTT